MTTRSVVALSHALVGGGGLPGVVARVEGQAALPPLRREYPLKSGGRLELRDSRTATTAAHR
jgi:hypothetical protein